MPGVAGRLPGGRGLRVELARHAGRAPEPRRAAARRGRRPGARLPLARRHRARLARGLAARPVVGRASHDGFVWGRGALDMKSQTAAEVVAGAALAREGWRPPRGELQVISVADEEVGGAGRRAVADRGPPRPGRAATMLLNEGAGPPIPYDGRRLYGVCCAEKGTFRFAVRTSGRAGHASMPALGRQRAAQARCRYVERLGSAARDARPDRPAARVPRRRSGSTRRTRDGALEHLPRDRPAARGDGRADVRRDVRADDHPGVEQDQRHARARRAEGRLPRAARAWAPRRRCARVHEALGDTDGYEVEFLEEVVGNGSPIESPLMDAIRDWVGERGARRRGRADDAARPSPTRARSATRSPTASPTASSPSGT